MQSSKELFSDRVADYVKYRPDYPAELFTALVKAASIGLGSTVADAGSGTGLFTRRLLATGAHVIALEPNAAMRQAAEVDLGGQPGFESRDGSAEATGLDDASVNVVTAAQAFHWFDPVAARAEFRRILKPKGLVALIWNQRKDNAANRAYETMLDRYAPDYARVREKDRAAESRIHAFFAPQTPATWTFPNAQIFDAAGLRGRLASSSYAPKAENPLHGPLYAELERVFNAYAEGNGADRRFLFEYDTVLWLGSL